MALTDCPAAVYRADNQTAELLQAADGFAICWRIDGAVAHGRRAFFRALATELHFPDYFGQNWDATYDCLTDLAGGDDRPTFVLIFDGDQFVAGMGQEWATAQRVFAEAAAFWRARERLLLVILVSDVDLPGVSPLPPTCLNQVVSAIVPDAEMTTVDTAIRTLNRAGSVDDALRTAQELVERFPDSARAHFILGGTLDFQGRERDALAPYQRAWQLGLGSDDLPRFYVQYGSTLRNVGTSGEAVRVLQEGRERFPDDAAIQVFLALAFFSAGRAAEALALALSMLTEGAAAIDLHGYDRAVRDYIAELTDPAEPQ